MEATDIHDTTRQTRAILANRSLRGFERQIVCEVRLSASREPFLTSQPDQPTRFPAIRVYPAQER